MTVERCDRTAWDALAEEHPPDFYGTSGWFEATCDALGLEPVYLAATGGDPYGFCFGRKTRPGTSMLLTPCFATYAGKMGNVDDNHKYLTDVAEWAERTMSYAHLVLPLSVQDIRPFIWRGWRSSVRYTYRVDLEHLTESALRRNVRRKLKTARKNGLESRIVTSREAAETAFSTVMESVNRGAWQFPVPQQKARDYFNTLVELPDVETVAVFRDEEPLATIVQGYDAGRVYHLQSGLTAVGTETGAGFLAMWVALESAAERVPGADLSGANMPAIAHFKQGFGGVLTPYYAVTWAKNAPARWLAETAPRIKAALMRKG